MKYCDQCHVSTRWVTVEQAAETVQRSERTIYYWIALDSFTSESCHAGVESGSVKSRCFAKERRSLTRGRHNGGHEAVRWPMISGPFFSFAGK